MLQIGQKVEINYAGQLEDGTEFVNTWLVPDPVTVTIGQSGLLPAFESQLMTMCRGERKKFVVPCEEAYGTYDQAAVVRIPVEGFPHADELPVGQYIEFNMAGGRGRAKVLSVQDGVATFDCNHELAGFDLHFEVELVDEGSGLAMDQETDATGCGCNKLRESLGGHEHHHHGCDCC